MQPPVCVVGVGADGWAGLTSVAQTELAAAEVIVGSPRQLDLLPASVAAARVSWPSPMLPALPGLLTAHDGRRVCVLASGDPMFYGVGTTLVRLLGAAAVRVVPHPSSVSLACARLGWPVEDVDVVSAVGRPLTTLVTFLAPGRRILVLGSSATAVTDLLADHGYRASDVTVLARLDGPDESISRGRIEHDPLAVVAIACALDPDAVPLSRVPGLPESAYDTDGQITKREIRALALANLAPLPGQLLWDVGAGSGSVGIEWLRTHPTCRAIAIEPRADRRDRITRNADALGVPGLQVVAGAAPEALAGLDSPDAVFVGGGVSVPGMLDACVAALRPGGRLVAHAVTLQSEAVLVGWHAHRGGSLVRVAVERAEPIGTFTGWQPSRPVVQWSLTT